MGKAASKLLFIIIIFYSYRVCFGERQQCTKLLGKTKSKERLQAAGEDTGEILLHQPAETLLKIWACFEIRHNKVV